MKNKSYIILSLMIMAMTILMTNFVFAEDMGDIYDECTDFSKAVAYSEGLTLDIVTEDNKYAFYGDDTHIIRVTSDPEWMVYQAVEGEYFIFNTCFAPSEEVSDFKFQYTEDSEYNPESENWIDFSPITTQKSTESYRWTPCVYSLKKLPDTAKYVKIVFQNVGGTPWSPCLESVQLKQKNNSEIGFIDCVNTKYYSATTKLKNLDLVSGYNSREFNPDGDITRAEFCTMIAKLLNMNTMLTAENHESMFADVSSDFWGAGAIYAMYGLGTVNGDENGNFNPDENIIMQDAVKIIVSSLGYTILAENNGGYPTGFINQANKLKLLKNVADISMTENINRGTAAILIDNSLSVPIMYQTLYGDQNTYTTDGTTALNKYYDINEKTGVLTDVGYASVYSETQNSDDRFVLGNSDIMDKTCKIGDVDMLEYLGMKVKVYMKYDKQRDEYTALYLEMDSSNKITSIDYNDYTGMDQGYIYYNSVDGRENKVSINPNTKVIYNYKYETRVALIDELPFKYCGNIKVISNGDGTSSADYIMIYDYDTYFIASLAKIGNTFSDKYRGAVNLNLNNADTIMLTNDGENIDFTLDYLLNENDVLCVAKSSDGKIADIKISIDTVVGDITNLNIADNEYTIAGKTLKLSNYFIDSGRKIELKNGEITAYLDISGNIVALSETSSIEMYGYLQDVTSDGDIFGGTATIRIVTKTGMADIVTVTSKSRLNGETGAVESFLNLSPQLVKYTLRSDGSIAELETAKDYLGEINTEEFALSYVSSSSKYYGDGLNIFASKYQLDASTKVFIVPSQNDKIEKYEVGNMSLLLSDTAYYVELFDLRDDYRVGAVVVKKTTDDGDIYNYSNVAVIINSGTFVNENGENCLSVMAYSGGEIIEIKFDGSGATDRTGYWLLDYEIRKTENGNNPFSAGEVIQYSNKGDYCTAFRMFLTRDMIDNENYYEKNIGDYGVLSEELFYSEMYTGFGTIERKFSDKVFLEADKTNLWQRTIPLSATEVYIYDRKKGNLTIGDNTDIEPGMLMFSFLRYSTVNTMLVIRN